MSLGRLTRGTLLVAGAALGLLAPSGDAQAGGLDLAKLHQKYVSASMRCARRSKSACRAAARYKRQIDAAKKKLGSKKRTSTRRRRSGKSAPANVHDAQIKSFRSMVSALRRKRRISGSQAKRLLRYLSKKDIKGFMRNLSRALKGSKPRGCKGFDPGCWARHAGNWIKGAARDVGKELGKAGRAIGKGLKKIGKAILENLPPPFGMIVKIVEGFAKFVKLCIKHRDVIKAAKAMWEDFKKDMEREGRNIKREFERTFKKFRGLLVMKRFSMGKIERFARDVAEMHKRLVLRFHLKIGSPRILSEFIAWITSYTAAYPTVLVGVTPIALTNFAFREIMKALIPQIILGVGKGFDAAKFVAKTAGRKFASSGIGKGFVKLLKDGVKWMMNNIGAAGGIIQMLIKDDKAKERLREVFRGVANVAGKIQKGIQGAMKIAEAARTGTFESVSSALNSKKTLPAKLSHQERLQMVGGLLDVAKEFGWAKLSEMLRKLLQKALGLIDRLTDVPRNAVVGAVGSIPFAGGVLASALNFGIGTLIGMVKDFFMDNMMKLARTLMDDTFKDIKNGIMRKLRHGKRGLKGFMALVRTVEKMAGKVNEQMSIAAQGVQGTIAQVAGAALDRFILRNISDPGLRGILSKGISFVLGKLAEKITSSAKSKPKAPKGGKSGSGFSLGGMSLQINLKAMVVKVLKYIKDPLARFVSDKIKQRELRAIVKRGLTRVIGAVANESAIGRLMKNPSGFLGDLGAKLIADNKRDIVKLIARGNRFVDKVAEAALDGLAGIIKKEGIRGLFKVNNIIAGLITVFQGAVLSKIPQPFGSIVQQAFNAIAPKLRTEQGRRWLVTQGPRALWNGIVAYLKMLYRKAKNFVKGAVASVKETIFGAIEALQSTSFDAGKAIGELMKLARAIKDGNIQLPRFDASLLSSL